MSGLIAALKNPPRPGELDSQDRQSGDDNRNSRPGQNEKGDPDQDNGKTDHAENETSGAQPHEPDKPRPRLARGFRFVIDVHRRNHPDILTVASGSTFGLPEKFLRKCFPPGRRTQYGLTERTAMKSLLQFIRPYFEGMELQFNGLVTANISPLSPFHQIGFHQHGLGVGDN
jgi:hypothetical protein